MTHGPANKGTVDGSPHLLLRALLFLCSISLLLHSALATQYEVGTRTFIVPFLSIGLSILFITTALRNTNVPGLATGAGFSLLALNLAFPPRPADFGRYFEVIRDLVWFDMGLGASMLSVGAYTLLLGYRVKRSRASLLDAPHPRHVNMLAFVGAMTVLGLAPILFGYFARSGFVTLPERARQMLFPLAFLFFVIDAPIFLALRLRDNRLSWFPIVGAIAPVVAAVPFVYSLPTVTTDALSAATDKMKLFASIVAPYGALMGLACGLLSRSIPSANTQIAGRP
jgi:hypothetical protein